MKSNDGKIILGSILLLLIINVYASRSFPVEYYNWKVGEIVAISSLLLVLLKAYLSRRHIKKINSYYKTGISFLEQGNYNEASKNFNKVLQADPESAHAHCGVANILYKRGKYGKALEHYHTALKLDPKNALAHWGVASVFYKQEKYDKALEHYHTAMQLTPKNAYARCGVASVLYEQGKYDEALEHYHKVIQFDPKNAWAYCGIASVLYEQEKYDEALKYYHKAIKLDSKNAIAYWGTANALCEQGKYHESFKYAKKAYHLAPKNPAIKKSFAEINLTNERFDKAITLANEVLAEQHVPAEHRLVMRFILFSALLFQKKRSEALVDLKCFIEQYESLSEDHEKGWNYNGLKHFINNTKKLSETDQSLLLTLIEILESPLSEAKEELITLEFSVYEVND